VPQAPAGFLPLENIVVRPLKDKCQFELAPQDGGLLKSVKMESGDKKKTGGLEQVASSSSSKYVWWACSSSSK
jgi:hypothetical protein